MLLRPIRHSHPGLFQQRIADVLPGFRMSDSERSRTFTLLDALEHRCSLPPHTWAWVFGDVDRATMIFERLPHWEMTPDKPGSYRYSNVMYMVLAQVLFNLTGETWEQQVLRLCEKMGAGHPALLLTRNWHEQPNMACGHRDGKPLAPFHACLGHPIAPASEMSLSSKELQVWLSHVLGELRASPPKFGGLIQAKRPSSALGALHTAEGFRAEHFRGHPLYWHSGQCTGFTAYTAWLPTRDAAIGLLCNENGQPDALQRLTYEFADRVLDHAPTSWQSVFPPPPPDGDPPETGSSVPTPIVPTPIQMDPAQMGSYSHPGYGSFEIVPGESGVDGIFQGLGKGPIHAAPGGRWSWNLSQYQRTFRVHLEKGALSIPFEPKVGDIRFQSGH